MKRTGVLLVILGLLLAPAGVFAAGGDAKPLMEWSFEKPGDLEGWQANSELKNVRVEEGELRGEVSGSDPFMTSPIFDISASPWQWIELEMKCSKSGRGEIYYSNTLQSEYEGFFPGKSTPFDLAGDGQWHTVRVFPFWHAEKKIIHIRVDLFSGTQFAIRSLRIMEPVGGAAAVNTPAFNFAGNAHGWTPVAGVSAPVVSGKGITVTVQDAKGTLRSPMLNVPLTDRMWVAIRMRVQKGARASLLWVSDAAAGMNSLDFPLRRDGRFHTYNIDAGSNGSWDGNLLSLGLRPSHTAGDRVEIESIRLEKDVVGDPDLGLVYFGLEDAINRAGKPCSLVAKFVNFGGKTATGLKATLTLPKGVTARPAAGNAPRFECQVPAAFRYMLTAKQPVEGKVTIRLAGPGAPTEAFTTAIRITPSPKVAKRGAVPPVRPAKTDYQIGMYYFPGWPTAEKWECIDRVAPIRKPVLGYYDEANPECADWQIKWAVEHGINFFLVDWYWSAGGRSLEHWVRDAYMKSRYRQNLQWAVMWANHNAPGTHSVEDWRKVTQYWIDNYFGMKEYLRINGKPAVFIWAPANIRRDLGGTEGAAKLLALSQEMAKQAGYPGITFAAMNAGGSPEDAKTLAAEGYTVNSTYHWWADAQQVAQDANHFPYSLVVDRSRKGWEEREKVVEGAGMTYVPTADTGWDSRPWHGDKSMVIDGRTPSQFERLLREAKSYMDARGEKMFILGPCNEWGEGSYIEPCAEYGFGMYDAVRRVFTKEPAVHTDLAPVDVGMGPYDLPLVSPKLNTAWLFDKADETEGWSATMGMSSATIRDGCLYGTTASTDPAFGTLTASIRASQFPYLVIRMKVSPTEGEQALQLFWSTATSAISEGNSISAKLIADGQFHTYVLPVGENPRWRGLIRSFRFDPCSVKGAEVWIDAIRLTKEKPGE